VFCITLAGCLPSAADTASLEDMRRWIGKYPFDEVEGQTFWQRLSQFVQNKKLPEGLTAERLVDVSVLGVSVPVQERNGVLYVAGCKAHACGSQTTSFFVDLEKKVLYACLRSEERAEDIWLSTEGAWEKLGREGCEETEPFRLLDKRLAGQAK